MSGNPNALPGGHLVGLGETRRTDGWWVGPLATVLFISAALAYGTWAMLQRDHYQAGPYLSPLFSPTTFYDPEVAGGAVPHQYGHVWFGLFPSWWPKWLMSPAFVILPLPGLLRFTCYYYRKAYYRSFGFSPPGCAVEGVRRGKYKGETGLFLVQNVHRYALYIALAYNVILYFDAFASLRYQGEWGVGVGSAVLFANATLLAAYSLGCHSFRHLIGGRLDCFTCDSGSKTCHGAWKLSTWFNVRHMQVAWSSLAVVMLTDVYVRLVSHGTIPDLNTWGADMSAVARGAATAMGL